MKPAPLVAALFGLLASAPHVIAQAPEPAAAFQRILDAYRAKPVAQTASIRVIAPEGRERISRVEVLTEPSPTSRRIALRLGRSLQVEASDRELRGVSPRNPTAACVLPLTGPLTDESLRAVLPPIPVPNIAWALGGEVVGEGAREGEFLVPPVGWVRLDSVEPRPGMGHIALRGSNPLGPVEIVVDESTHMLVRLTGTLSGPALRVELAFRGADPGSKSWAVEIEGRERVPSLSDLKPLPAEVQPGAQVGSLSLMGTDLSPWLLADTMREQAAIPTEAGEGPILGALVVYRSSAPGAEDAAFQACGSLRSHKKFLDRKRLTADPATPRLFIRPVAVFELPEFSPGAARELAARWAGTGDTPVWTSAGQALIDRFDRGAIGAVIIVDLEGVLLGAATLEAGPQAGDAALVEVRAIIEETAVPK
ncbi:hypothetical protein PHYC_02804 [Phycisphaerales bacterium]|nr:hypothetical protein PHYC_02804 [Phycisphaerales bacterium]